MEFRHFVFESEIAVQVALYGNNCISHNTRLIYAVRQADETYVTGLMRTRLEHKTARAAMKYLASFATTKEWWLEYDNQSLWIGVLADLDLNSLEKLKLFGEFKRYRDNRVGVLNPLPPLTIEVISSNSNIDSPRRLSVSKDEGGDGIKTPSRMSPTDAREQRVMSVLGTRTGWDFIAYVKLTPMGVDQVLGSRLQNGVKIQQRETSLEVITGKGIVEKYTDANLPKMSAANKVELRGDNIEALVLEKAEDNFSDVREVEQGGAGETVDMTEEVIDDAAETTASPFNQDTVDLDELLRM